VVPALRITVKPASSFFKLKVVAQNRWLLIEGLRTGTGADYQCICNWQVTRQHLPVAELLCSSTADATCSDDSVICDSVGLCTWRNYCSCWWHILNILCHQFFQLNSKHVCRTFECIITNCFWYSLHNKNGLFIYDMSVFFNFLSTSRLFYNVNLK